MRLISLLTTIFICQLGSAQILSETIGVEQDATTRVAFPTTNYGNIDSIYCGFEAATGAYQRLYLEFSMDALPPEAIIISAKLVLHPKSIMPGNNNDLTLSRLDSNWIDTSITWNNQPGVITSDQVQIADSETTDPVKHEFDVIDHLEYFNFYEHLNFGWELRMYSETGASNTGISYYSQECVTDSLRPKLEVEYVLPLDFKVNVSHCTNGNSDGSYTVDILGGGSQGTNYIYYLRKRTDSSYVVVDALASPTTADMENDNLSPGLYHLVIRDSLYLIVDPVRRDFLDFHKWFIIGEEGEVTTVNFATPGGRLGEVYFDDLVIGRNTQTNLGGIKYSDINYNPNNQFGPAYSVPSATSGYEFAGMIKFEMDFDPSLDFNSAELILNKHVYYNGHYSENSVNCRRITSWWRDAVTTWNTRPTVDSTVNYVLPTIAVTGHGGGPDTLNLLSFVEYWQLNQDENFGIEMSVNYGQTQNALRQFKPSNYSNGPNLKLSFTVKDPLVASFDEATGLGSIEVNAPSGELPYTYLLTLNEVTDLNVLWNELKDTIPIDSNEFFQGKINSKSFHYKSLNADYYFLAIFDNNGDLLENYEFPLGPDVDFFENTDATISERNISVSSTATEAKVTLNGLLYDNESGGVQFTTDNSGDVSIGFNKIESLVSNNPLDLEFGLDLTSTGNYNLLFDRQIVATGSLSVGSKVQLYKSNYEFVFLVENEVKYRIDIPVSMKNEWKIDAILKSGQSKLNDVLLIHDMSKVIRPIKTKSRQSECEMNNGKLYFTNSSHPSLSNGTITGTITITDQLTSTIVSIVNFNGGAPSSAILPTGTYEVEYIWSNGTLSYSWVEIHEIGNPIQWDVENQYFVYENGTVNTLNSNSGGVGEAKSFNTWPSGELGFVKFNVHTTPISKYSHTGAALPLVPAFLDFKLINTQDQQEFEFKVFELGIFSYKYINAYDENGALINSTYTYGNGPFKINLESGSPNVFKIYFGNNPTLLATTEQVYNSSYKLDVEGTNASIYETYASFCGIPTSDRCASLDYELDGNYYVTTNGKLCFVYNEEYNDSNVEFNIYNNAGDLVYTEADFNVPNLIHGENRIELDFLDFDCSNQGFYVLEVINDKKEKFFLRFYYKHMLSNSTSCYEVVNEGTF